jgi:hypothetical protein
MSIPLRLPAEESRLRGGALVDVYYQDRVGCIWYSADFLFLEHGERGFGPRMGGFRMDWAKRNRISIDDFDSRLDGEPA